MKNRITIAIVLFLAVVNYIAAENRMSMMDFSISAGETKEVSVLLDNETQYVAFQFDLYLPTGISLAGYEVNSERVPSSTEVSMAQQEDGSYRFFAAAMAMEPIVGNNGGIITLKLKASANVVTGNRSGYLRSVKLSKEDGAGQTTFEVPFTVKVLEPSIVTAKSYTKEYGEKNPTFEYDVKGGELEGAPEISCEATAVSPVGTYPIVVKKGTVTNYNDSYVNGTLTITKAPLTITAQSYTIKQGETLPTFEVSYSGFKNNETEDALTKKPTITCIATSGSAVGTYDIVVSGAESGNYDIAFANGMLVIADADPVTVTAKSYTRAYGDANPTFEYTSEGKALVGTPEISCEATAVSPVGTYPIVVKKGTVTNYNDSYVNGTLTITKAPLTITAQNYVIKQGEELPAFEASYTGFKNGETDNVLTRKPRIVCDATSSNKLGTYGITVSDAESQNYEMEYVSGTLSVIDADAVVVTAKSYYREYGESNPTFEYDVVGKTLVGTPEISCEATAVSPVGTYPIVVKKGTVTNYNDSYVNGTLTITKAPLTITAQSCTIKQGETLPTFEVSYSGFKNNETEEALTKKPTITCIATSGSAVGTYDIVVSGAESGNYDIAFANGTLVIADADPVTVTAKSYTRAYGDANPTFEYTSEGKALVGTPEISCEATTVSPVGTYPIVVKKGAVTNYNDSYVNGTLTITKAPLTITAQSYTIKQGEALPTFEVTYSGFKNKETEKVLTKKATIACAATSKIPGTYDIVISGAESDNYEFTYVAGVLTIEEAVKIVPMLEETEVVFDEIIPEETDLKDVVIDNVYVTLDTDADDGYDKEEKCIVLASIMEEEQLDAITDKKVYDETVKENFNGLIFAVPASKGVISITAKTKGNRILNVKIGDADPQTFVQPERGVVKIPYVSDKDTYVYVYGADVAVSGKRKVASADIDNGVLIYNIKWVAEELTDIDSITIEENDCYQIYTPDGKSVETMQKGVNIIRYSNGTTKSVYMK